MGGDWFKVTKIPPFFAVRLILFFRYPEDP